MAEEFFVHDPQKEAGQLGRSREPLPARSEGSIQTLACSIRLQVHERWQPVLEEGHEEFLRLYDEAGEPAYGAYARRLFRPVREQIEGAGFLCVPRFPGALSVSREWGPPEERERWMWSVVRRAQGAPVGTIVVVLSHDHTQFRVPRPPGILALEETDAGAIDRAVARAAGHQKGGEG